MSYYFAWVEADELFDPKQHCREDEKIFSLEIRQREGGLATAQIVIENPKVGLLGEARKLYAMITYNQDLLFKGRVVGMPIQIEGEAVRLLLVAQPKNYQQQLQALVQDLKVAPFWDELFVGAAEDKRPLEVLEARSALYYCSRTTGEVAISDIFTGSRHFNIEGKYFRDSLQVHVGEAPLASVEVELSVEWSQCGYGTCDVTPQLMAEFPMGLISTYTGHDLEAKWWRSGEKVGQTGYWVNSSYLQQIPAPNTGILNLYPKASPKVWMQPDKPWEAPKHVRFQRQWYAAELHLGWRYQQTRQEVAHFTLEHDTQCLMPHTPRRRRLSLRLQKIIGESHAWCAGHKYTPGFRIVFADKIYRCIKQHRSTDQFEAKYWHCVGQGQHSDVQSKRASFFLTDRGVQAIQHAVERARAHLAASARAISIKVRAPFDSLLHITTDASLSLEDDRLPGRRVTGKVIAYRLFAEGKQGKQFIEVELGVAIGTGKTDQTSPSPTAKSDYVEVGFTFDSWQKTATDSGIEIASWQDQAPTKGILYPTALTSRDFIQAIEIINDPDIQVQHLLHNQYPETLNLKQTLLEKPTDIRIKLLDLGTQPRLKHEIVIPIVHPWSAPKQIDLG